MISARQIRAARGLLGWDATELAEKAGLTRETISRIESEQVAPQERTIEKIFRAFDTHGIEFTDNHGVRIRPKGIQLFQGQDGLIALMEDVYESCRQGVARDIVLSGVSESDFQKTLGDYDAVYLSKMSRLPAVHMRHLIAEGDYNAVSSSYSEYKWVPKSQFKAVPFYVYADKLAIILFSEEPSPKIFLIQSIEIADAYRSQFEAMWAQAMDIPEGKAK